jgi:hypothetical protein
MGINDNKLHTSLSPVNRKQAVTTCRQLLTTRPILIIPPVQAPYASCPW